MKLLGNEAEILLRLLEGESIDLNKQGNPEAMQRLKDKGLIEGRQLTDLGEEEAKWRKKVLDRDQDIYEIQPGGGYIRELHFVYEPITSYSFAWNWCGLRGVSMVKHHPKRKENYFEIKNTSFWIDGEPLQNGELTFNMPDPNIVQQWGEGLTTSLSGEDLWKMNNRYFKFFLDLEEPCFYDAYSLTSFQSWLLTDPQLLNSAWFMAATGAFGGGKTAGGEGLAYVCRHGKTVSPSVAYIGRSLERLQMTPFVDEFDVIAEMNPELTRMARMSQRRGQCLTGDSRILQPNGSLPTIKQMVKEKKGKVVTLNPGLKLQAENIDNFLELRESKLIQVETRTGKKIKVTPEHPFLTFQGWIEARNLKEGGYIATPRTLPFFGKKHVSDEKARALGYLLSDGCFGRREVTFCNGNKELIDEFKEITEEMGGTIKTYQKYSHRPVFSSREGEPSRPNPFMTWAREWKLIGKKAGEKFIPTEVFEWEKRLISLFLNRLFAGDGSASRRTIEYSSVSEVLVREVQHLLLRFGIISKISKHPCFLSQEFGEQKRTLDKWRLRIGDVENIQRFLEKIGIFGKDLSITSEYCKSHKSASIFDIIPKEFRDEIIEVKEKKGYSYADIGRMVGASGSPRHYRSNLIFDGNIRRKTAIKLAELLNSQKLKRKANSQIFWDKINKIKELPPETVYDLTVNPTHNFVANGFIVHNTYDRSTKSGIPQSFKVFGIWIMSVHGELEDALRTRTLPVPTQETQNADIPILQVLKQTMGRQLYTQMWMWYMDSLDHISYQYGAKSNSLNNENNDPLNIFDIFDIFDHRSNNNNSMKDLQRQVSTHLTSFLREGQISQISQNKGRNAELMYHMFKVSNIIGVDIDQSITRLFQVKSEVEEEAREIGELGLLRDFLVETYRKHRENQNYWTRTGDFMISNKECFTAFTEYLHRHESSAVSRTKFKSLLRELGFIRPTSRKKMGILTWAEIQGGESDPGEHVRLANIYTVNVCRRLGLTVEKPKFVMGLEDYQETVEYEDTLGNTMKYVLNTIRQLAEDGEVDVEELREITQLDNLDTILKLMERDGIIFYPGQDNSRIKLVS